MICHLMHSLVRRQRLTCCNEPARLADRNGLHWHVVTSEQNLANFNRRGKMDAMADKKKGTDNRVDCYLIVGVCDV